MKLIDEIIDTLISTDGKLSDALVKTKVLLHKIGHKDLVPWVNNELNGYPDRDSVPEYRILPAEVRVNAANLAWQMNNHPIPLGHLSAEDRENIETARFSQALAVLEQFSEDKGGQLEAHIPMEVYGLLGKGLDSSYHISRAWSLISNTSIIQIITQVKSRLLDFVLELRDQLPDELNATQMKKKLNSIDADVMFNNAIFGDNATIILGSNNKQSVSNVIVKDNFGTLSELLAENGISQKDINKLEEAISDDTDLVDQKSQKFGPTVRSWLKTMLGKAVDTTWKIEVNVASNLLYTVIKNYYGWS